MVTSAGVQYSVPDINGNQIALVYNKALVSEAPDTWDELVAAAKEVRDVADTANATYGFLYNEKSHSGSLVSSMVSAAQLWMQTTTNTKHTRNG